MSFVRHCDSFDHASSSAALPKNLHGFLAPGASFARAGAGELDLPARSPRVLVVEPYPLMAAAVAEVVTSEQCVVATRAHSAAEGRRAMQDDPPDLLILELELGREDGVELIKFCLAQHSALRVLVYSQWDELIYAERCLKAGAAAYVMKNEPSDRLRRALRAVLAGHVYLSPRVASHFFARSSYEAAEAPQAWSLTDRQLHIFRLLGEGLPVREIARSLGISTKTAEAHCEQMKVRLGLPRLAMLRARAEEWLSSSRGAQIVSVGT